MRTENNHILLFLALAFGIPLICSLFLMLPFFQTGIWYWCFYGIEGASPALAAVLTICLTKKEQSLKNFLKDKYRWNFSLFYCILGFCIPVVVLTVGKLLSQLWIRQNDFFTIPSMKKLVIILWALIAEELGWRGYLQEKLEKVIGSNWTPMVVGTIWNLWHYHFFLIGSMEVPLLAFAYGCIVESYGYYVITKLANGNVLPASLWHFSGNLFFRIYMINPNWNQGSMIPYVIVNALYTVYVLWFMMYQRKLRRCKVW